MNGLRTRLVWRVATTSGRLSSHIPNHGEGNSPYSTLRSWSTGGARRTNKARLVQWLEFSLPISSWNSEGPEFESRIAQLHLRNFCSFTFMIVCGCQFADWLSPLGCPRSVSIWTCVRMMCTVPCQRILRAEAGCGPSASPSADSAQAAKRHLLPPAFASNSVSNLTTNHNKGFLRLGDAQSTICK